MSNTREKFTQEQIDLAVDFTLKHHTSVFHPEDRNLMGLWVDFKKLDAKIASLPEKEKEARRKREAEYLEDFRAKLTKYLADNNPRFEGIASDYGVQDSLETAVEGTHVSFSGNFWAVIMSKDGKVYHREGRYGQNQLIDSDNNHEKQLGKRLSI